jgi:hypothetical protein
MPPDAQPCRKDVRYLYLDAWLHNASLGLSVPESCSHSTRIAQASSYGKTKSINCLQDYNEENMRQEHKNVGNIQRNFTSSFLQNQHAIHQSTKPCMSQVTTFIKQKNARTQLSQFFLLFSIRRQSYKVLEP